MYREDPASIAIAVLKSVFGDLECIVPYPQKAGKTSRNRKRTYRQIQLTQPTNNRW